MILVTVLIVALAEFFIIVKAASNWPGADDVKNVDPDGNVGENLSGLAFSKFSKDEYDYDEDVIWGVKNSPPLLYKFMWNGDHWSNKNGNWDDGKAITYPNGEGEPDSEDLTLDDNSNIFVSCERDNSNPDKSRLSVLKFTELNVNQGSDSDNDDVAFKASIEWDLTIDLPDVDPNLGLEAITWVPDAYLTDRDFLDENTMEIYDPFKYPKHGNGLFFVGLEGNGYIYGYALEKVDDEDAVNTPGNYTRIASFSSGDTSIMSLSFDADSGYLWAGSDSSCDGRSRMFEVNKSLNLKDRTEGKVRGSFSLVAVYDRPNSMPNTDTEGFTIVPDAYCGASDSDHASVAVPSSDLKAVFWADDASQGDNALRMGSIPCGAFLTPAHGIDA